VALAATISSKGELVLPDNTLIFFLAASSQMLHNYKENSLKTEHFHKNRE
jgi:hypothetical protein